MPPTLSLSTGRDLKGDFYIKLQGQGREAFRITEATLEDPNQGYLKLVKYQTTESSLTLVSKFFTS
jgi:hypothetical protein